MENRKHSISSLSNRGFVVKITHINDIFIEWAFSQQDPLYFFMIGISDGE